VAKTNKADPGGVCLDDTSSGPFEAAKLDGGPKPDVTPPDAGPKVEGATKVDAPPTKEASTKAEASTTKDGQSKE
jgi:hypothetical protein